MPSPSSHCPSRTVAGREHRTGWNGASEEIRRRERVIRIFPNRQPAIRLLGALLMEQDEQWSTGKRYFDMTTYWQWRQTANGGRAPGSLHRSVDETVPAAGGA